jgi:hypothetical protein
MANGAESSLTVAAPSARRRRIARRVGSARAAKVVLKGSAAEGTDFRESGVERAAMVVVYV